MDKLQPQPTPPPSSSELPPPDYVPSQPQILITPLPDSASFFWGKSVQGEIYVKGLGQGRGNRIDIVKSLSINLSLTNHLPQHPTIILQESPIQTLYPPQPISEVSTSTSPSPDATPFPTVHRFMIPLPVSSDDVTEKSLPGTLNLTAYEKGEIRYTLSTKLELPDGQIVQEEIRIEGTPQQIVSSSFNDEQLEEVEEKLEKDGVLARLLIDKDRPRLGDLLRLGVEIRPIEREKKRTGVVDLAKQTNPIETLRPLRRVRVELYRKVIIHSNSITSSQPSSSSSPSPSTEHITLLHATGKSLRYPGSGKKYPPLRVLFTIPTAQLGIIAEQTWGEITCSTKYHSIQFFIKVIIGFGDISASKDWNLIKSITIRPKKWAQPSTHSLQSSTMESNIHGMPVNGQASSSHNVERQGSGASWSEEEYKKEAYRQKGKDVVGSTGTFRFPDNDNTGGSSSDLPPPFFENDDNQAGPSSSSTRNSNAHVQHGVLNVPSSSSSELPSFLESEEQARTGEIPILEKPIESERLVPVNFDRDDQIDIPDEDEVIENANHSSSEENHSDIGPAFDRNNWVGRRGSLRGELGTWVEYDGYETFSVAPPSMAASFGAGGAMDPPQEGDDSNAGLVDGMVARLGLEGDGVSMQGLELMEHLGLGEGTRVVDSLDDLPPGIDEPSLPALPDFHAHSHTHSPQQQHHAIVPNSPPPPAHAPYISPPSHSQHLPPPPISPMAHDPPSFDASQAANAVGGVATSHIRSSTNPTSADPSGRIGHGARRPSRHAIDDAVGIVDNAGNHPGDAPPGYERTGTEGGLPPYS
ncbi:uncharacterized protein L201_001299 [Kwoniella dendrophila CBS 6074]|uniref:Arrestin C-terminal-like domain-containing protein n=1 Tax=Kwoniella dendrophila CBS 6074 TaxID=1295534 RepID=A0AAX4JLV8_9TREE